MARVIPVQQIDTCGVTLLTSGGSDSDYAESRSCLNANERDECEMKTTNADEIRAGADLPLLECVNHFDQVKEEHDELQRRLSDLTAAVNGAAGLEPADDAAMFLRVRGKFLAFMDDLELYYAKEERMLFPVAGPHTGGAAGPVQALMRDHAQTKQLLATFLEEADLFAALGDRREAEDALICLVETLTIAAEHLRIEHCTLFPATERLMDDIAYSSL